MPQSPGSNDEGNAVVEHQRSRRVPEIVESDHRQTSFADQDFEIPEQIAGVDRTADL